MKKCVIGRDGVGGRAYEIGGDDRLIVVMAGFNPHVDCLGAMAAPLDSCGAIIQQMRKDYEPLKFGRPWDKTINYALPLVLTAPDGKCQVVVDTLGPTVQANWNGIWQAVLSTIALCGRAGKGGKASVTTFPIAEGLFLQVHDRVLPPPLAVGPNGTFDTAAVETMTPLSAVSATEPWGLLLPSVASESPAILPSSAPTVASS
ncbi:hypothetical protein ABVK25_004009 [Lepraria finkii]|uniref:Uncharacterized protein n=1 Tax=Lepraria finkii TaxID=1340010 RepID=A0ABR4BDG6_9LECA